MTNKSKSYIAVVLDRSGSMESVRQATIDGFNEFVNKQRQEPGEATLLLTQFDDVYERVFEKSLPDVPKLTKDTYVPRNMTALFDAMGKTINDVGAALEKLSEAERPAHVIVVVLTDGHENASKEFNQLQVANMVKHQRDKYAWDFVFLGANQDAVLTAAKFNIPQVSAMTYTSNQQSIRSVSASLGNYVAQRRAGRSAAFTKEDRTDAQQGEQKQ